MPLRIWQAARISFNPVSASSFALTGRFDCKIAYFLNDWDGFTAFLTDGRICLTNNAVERELRGVARGRKAWLFVGSDRGGERAAMMFSFFGTACLNGVDPLAWFTDVLTRIADIPQNQLHELLPWNWKAAQQTNRAEIAA